MVKSISSPHLIAEGFRPSRRSFITTAGLSTFAPWTSVTHLLGATPTRKLVGITVFPEYIQSEGIDAVLGSLIERAGANAVTTSPYVMQPSTAEKGSREPPIDAGAGTVRLLDRPLFGKRELWVETAPSFTPDRSMYRNQRYQPPLPNELTEREGPKVAAFINQAKAAGLKVYLQVQAASPPGYRVQFSGVSEDDQPRRFDGQVPSQRVDKNGSLASEHIRRYTQSMLVDLAKQYPQIDGFRIDWPEYPPYFLDTLFVDYSESATAAARRLGYSPDSMIRDTKRFHDFLLGRLTNHHLEQVLEDDGGRYSLMLGMAGLPELSSIFSFRSMLVRELVAGARQALDQAGFVKLELVPNAFPPPWNIASGFPFHGWDRTVDAISVKEYTMHWPMMVRFYGETILQANPQLDENLLIKALVRLLDIDDPSRYSRLSDLRYPEPSAPHPCGDQALQRKIRQSQTAAGKTPILALAHGYGPVDDFHRRLKAASEASQHGFWVNRYGYLSDEKLQVIRQFS